MPETLKDLTVQEALAIQAEEEDGRIGGDLPKTGKSLRAMHSSGACSSSSSAS